MHSTDAQIEQWLGTHLDALQVGEERSAFVAVVKGNVLFPAEVDELVAVVASDSVPVSADATAQITEAGPEFFVRAGSLLAANAGDFKGWTRAVAAATGRKGAKLFMPLRSALTGATHGPELAPLVGLMGTARVLGRLESARSLATRN